MRVGFDEQILLRQRVGGVSRYVVELVRAFQEDPSLGVEPVPGWRYAANVHAVDAGLARRAPETPHRRATRWLSTAANTAARRRARRTDVLHRTYFEPRYLSARTAAATVTTVYDMIPELLPQFYPDRNPHEAKARYVAESDLVLCISESTRSDVMRLLGDPGVPVLVVPLGVSDEWFHQQPPPPPTESGYVLYVGSRALYKDFDVLLQAMTRIDPAWGLLAVGGGPLTADEESTVAALGLADRVQQRPATDAEMPGLYREAGAFVFPSRYEGFGLPTVEAMASGCPPVLARSSSHPEVGGDVARYFAPQDADDLAHVLGGLLGDVELRAELAVRAVDRARRFTWARTAAETAAAYRKVA